MGMEDKLSGLLQLMPPKMVQREGVRLIFPAYVYWLWRARNLKIFEGKISTPETLFMLGCAWQLTTTL